MTGDDVRLIRERLSKELGRHVSQHDLGKGLKLAAANAGNTVRRWEQICSSGPAGVALGYLRQGLETTLPEFLTARDGVGDLYIVRNHWPRFVGKVRGGGFEVVEWIDRPNQFGDSVADIHRKAFKDAPIP